MGREWRPTFLSIFLYSSHVLQHKNDPSTQFAKLHFLLSSVSQGKFEMFEKLIHSAKSRNFSNNYSGTKVSKKSGVPLNLCYIYYCLSEWFTVENCTKKCNVSKCKTGLVTKISNRHLSCSNIAIQMLKTKKLRIKKTILQDT